MILITPDQMQFFERFVTILSIKTFFQHYHFILFKEQLLS